MLPRIILTLIVWVFPAVAAPSDATGQTAGDVPTFESAHLLRTPLSYFSNFGASISIHNDLMAVAAPMAVVEGVSAGAVYIYRYYNGIWELEARLTSPANVDDGEEFGRSVAIVEDLDTEQLIVGSPGPLGGDRPGKAFIFERTGGEWMWVQTLSGTSSSDYFGASLSVDKGVLAVGAPVGAAGAVYVFERAADDEFVLASMLPYSGPQFMGDQVIASGNRVVAGTGDPESNPTTIHVFEKESDKWVFNSVVSTPRTVRIGAGMAFDSKYLLLQSTTDPENGVTNPGVFVFRRGAVAGNHLQ